MVGLLLHKLRRDIARQRGQFIAVMVTIFLGVTLFGASYDAYQNLRASYDKTFEDLSVAHLWSSGGDTRAIVEQARGTDGVEAVATRTVVDVPFQIGESNKLIGRVIGMPAGSQPAVTQVHVLSGDYLSTDQPHGVLVEQHMAEHFDLSAGDSLEIGTAAGDQAFNVEMVGTVASAEYLWPARSRQEIFPSPDQFGVLFVPETFAAEIAGGQGTTEVMIRYAARATRQALHRQLGTMARENGATGIVTRDEQPSNATLSLDIEGFQQLSFLFPLLFLTAAASGTYVLANRIVHSQRSQIGMLMANGFSQRTVLLHYLSYGVIVGLVGAIPGAIAGAALARYVTSLYLDELSIPIAASNVRPISTLIGIALGLLMGSIATVAPALTASRLSPVEAMRGITTSGTGKPSLIERLLPPLHRLPVRWKLVIRGIGRSKRRSISTMIGVILALVLVLVSWTMIDTVNILLDRQFDRIEQQDAKVYFATPGASGTVEELQAITGIQLVEPSVEVPVTVQHGDSQYQTSLRGLESGTELHTFLDESGNAVQLPSSGILIGTVLRDELGVSRGDEVTLLLPELGGSVNVTVAGFTDEPLGTFAYASLDHLAEITGVPSADAAVNVALVRYGEDVDRDAVADRISSLPAVVAVRDTRYLADTIRNYMSLFYAFVGVMLAFGGVMAFSLIFNTMSINITERSIELATLEASGMEERGIRRLVVAENVLLVVIAIAPGLLAGYYCARWFMGIFSSDLFQFDLQVYPPTFVLAALAILVVAVLSLWPGLRAISRLDVPRVMRERAA